MSELSEVMDKTRWISLKLGNSEIEKLDHLARQVDRNRSQILRRLIILADELPDARRLLGDPRPTGVNHEPTNRASNAELLAACEAVISWGNRNMIDYPGFDEVCNSIRTAIAHAKGDA